MSLRLLPMALLFAGCSDPQVITGQVVDIWGDPVPDARVAVEGQSWSPTTDEHGYFEVPFTTGELRMKAGRKGYIQDHQQIEVTDPESAPTPVFHLYPKPSDNGFYVIGTQGYQPVEPQPVYALGHDVKTITGLKSAPEATAEGDLRVVFHTDLQKDELARFGLELHALEFRQTMKVKGPLGEAEVPVNLYVSKGPVDIDIEPMRSANDYLITASDLEAGKYAFHTMELLSPRDGASFEKIPEPLRVAFPLEVR